MALKNRRPDLNLMVKEEKQVAEKMADGMSKTDAENYYYNRRWAGISLGYSKRKKS